MELTTIQQIIAIVAGLIGIITGIVTFSKWIANRRKSKLLKVFEENGNIFGVFHEGSQIQLTHLGKDKDPIYVRKKSRVVFFRSMEAFRTVDMEPLRKGRYRKFSIVSMQANTLEETVLTDQKPFLDGLDGTYELLSYKEPKVSNDNRWLYFITGKWATASVLMAIDIKSGKSKELFSAEHFDFIKRGRFNGKFLVAISAIVDNEGRDIHYRVYNKRGKTLKKFESEEEYKEFRGKFV